MIVELFVECSAQNGNLSTNAGSSECRGHLFHLISLYPPVINLESIGNAIGTETSLKGVVAETPPFKCCLDL